MRYLTPIYPDCAYDGRHPQKGDTIACASCGDDVVDINEDLYSGMLEWTNAITFRPGQKVPEVGTPYSISCRCGAVIFASYPSEFEGRLKHETPNLEFKVA